MPTEQATTWSTRLERITKCFIFFFIIIIIIIIIIVIIIIIIIIIIFNDTRTADITNTYGTVFTLLLTYLLSLTYLIRLTMTYTYLQYLQHWKPTYLLKIHSQWLTLIYNTYDTTKSHKQKRSTKQYTIQL